MPDKSTSGDAGFGAGELAASLRQFFCDSTFLYRDVELDSTIHELYQPGRLFREPNLLVASNKFGGFAANTRFVIVTTTPREISNLVEHVEWGLCVLERNQLLKVIDRQSYGPYHQITLIHITHEFDYFFRSGESRQFEQSLCILARLKLTQACRLQPLAALMSQAWKDRTTWPLGLNNEGHLLIA